VIRYLEEVDGDISAVEAWYAAQSLRAAAAFVAELEVAWERIAEGPSRWPKGACNTRKYLLKRFPYHVVYRIAAEDIVVIAVASGRRGPGFWLRRLRRLR
jgi:plasmid stabilization system protein ParE